MTLHKFYRRSSGRNTTRPPLTREQIETNAKTYLDQATLVLDKNKTEVRYNSEWTNKLGADGLIKLASRYPWLKSFWSGMIFYKRYAENAPYRHARTHLSIDARLRLRCFGNPMLSLAVPIRDFNL